MYRALTDEQQFLVEAAADALGRIDAFEEARAALDGAELPSRWSLATEAGWPGLLVREDADGAGLSAGEAVLVLEACGRALVDPQLLGHVPATALLDAAGEPADLLGPLASGERRAALVDATVSERSRPVIARREGDAVLLEGSVRTVVDAEGADVLVVVAEVDGVPLAAVVEDGVTITPLPSYDATRAVADVAFDGVRGRVLDLATERVRDGADLQRLLLAAESVGGADACLAMARDYAVDRFAFGRAIGSYQAIKHKLVEMLRRTENARSLLIAAARDWDEDRGRFVLSANAARVAAADALDYSAPENIFIHGGVGATWEHDASLLYRRAEHARRLAGGAPAAADAVAEALFALVPQTTNPAPEPAAARA